MIQQQATPSTLRCKVVAQEPVSLQEAVQLAQLEQHIVKEIKKQREMECEDGFSQTQL